MDQALATLRAIDFGLAEDMQSTQALLQHAWATKFNFGEYRKNATGTPGAEWTARNIQRIVDLNTLDVALYHEAKVLFYTRVRNVSALETNVGRWYPFAVYAARSTRTGDKCQ